MPIFISYSHADTEFVEDLAKNLVAARHNVWIDRWELKVGDSLHQNIQKALNDASAILLILSRTSVESNWVRQELTAGLVRELEENRTLVLPCVIDDCEIPLFLRDKVRADFRADPDTAFALVDRSLGRVSNVQQGRNESPNFHTDWAYDWGSIDGNHFFTWTFVEHGAEVPYVISTECNILCDNDATARFVAIQDSGERQQFIHGALSLLIASSDRNQLTIRIRDAFRQEMNFSFLDPDGSSYVASIRCRRMGEDNGMDTVVFLDRTFNSALNSIRARLVGT